MYTYSLYACRLLATRPTYCTCLVMVLDMFLHFVRVEQKKVSHTYLRSSCHRPLQHRESLQDVCTVKPNSLATTAGLMSIASKVLTWRPQLSWSVPYTKGEKEEKVDMIKAMNNYFVGKETSVHQRWQTFPRPAWTWTGVNGLAGHS